AAAEAQKSSGIQQGSVEARKNNAKIQQHGGARRGQTTNNHYLAERVRRGKTSERMKFLQGLVPGCSKVIYVPTIPCSGGIYSLIVYRYRFMYEYSGYFTSVFFKILNLCFS
ncbi:hypothetical protein SOVF_141100, partial [Spinacia oleracea]